MANQVDSAKPQEPVAYRIQGFGGVRKASDPNGARNPGDAIQGNAYEPEDEYQQLYVGATRDQGIIQPPYTLRLLDRLAQENNALGPCIEAMVTNIDGTGYEFDSDDDESNDSHDDAKLKQLKDFFDQPWPGQSFKTMKKELRRDRERTGNAYLEVLRNAKDEIVFVRRVDAKMMRLLRLDEAVPTDVKVMRGGVEVKVNVMKRERRYCQLVNGVSLMYFKEFGSKRDLHKKSAVWAPQGQRLRADQRATEIIHFTVLLDSHTPYGVPRWIAQVPSVIGSRKAEEFNMEFFDNGGIPPVLIILQGGTMIPETRKAMEAKMTGRAADNNRVQIIEVQPSSGSLDSAGNSRVTVERFGAERQNDSMFEKYDERCEQRVRRAFRLPPIFVGMAEDYSFATAFASYTVGEAQVFAPERHDDDEIISMKLLPEMGYPGYRMRSKPLVIEDATLKLEAIDRVIALGDQVEPADLVKEINRFANMNLKVSPSAVTLKDREAKANQFAALPPGSTHTMDSQGNIQPIQSPAGAAEPGASPKAPGGDKGQPGPKAGPTPKAPPSRGGLTKAEPLNGFELASSTMEALRKRDAVTLTENLAFIAGFDAAGHASFNEIVTSMLFADPSLDPEGLNELSQCTSSIIAAHSFAH